MNTPHWLPLSLVALLLALAPGAAHAGAGYPGRVTIGKVLPRPGTVRQVTETQGLSFDFMINGQAVKNDKLERKVLREEVLALTGRITTRLKVTYTTHTERETKAGQVSTKTQPTQGKTYILSLVAGKVTVTDGAGFVVGAGEEKLVRKDHKEFGEPDRIWESIPTTSLAVGADVPALARGIQKSFEQSMRRDQKPGETWAVDSVSARLRSVTGVGADRQATFAVGIKARHGAANGFTMVFDLAGDFTVRVSDGWTVRLQLKGPLEIMGQKNAGLMDSTQTSTYP